MMKDHERSITLNEAESGKSVTLSVEIDEILNVIL